MSGPAQDLAASARRIDYEWLEASLTWTDNTAADFHDRYWSELEREAGEIAREATVLDAVLIRARNAVEL